MPKSLSSGSLPAFKGMMCAAGLEPWPEAKDRKSHFTSSHHMTLNQPFLWLSLGFPIWTMRWLDQLISKTSPTLTPCTPGPKSPLVLRKDILWWLEHQERLSFLGDKHKEARDLPLSPWGDKKMVIPSLWRTLQAAPTQPPGQFPHSVRYVHK